MNIRNKVICKIKEENKDMQAFQGMEIVWVG